MSKVRIELELTKDEQEMARTAHSLLGKLCGVSNEKEESFAYHVQRVNGLAYLLAEREGWDVTTEGFLFYDSINPHSQRYWRLACTAYEYVTGRDVEEMMRAFFHDEDEDESDEDNSKSQKRREKG